MGSPPPPAVNNNLGTAGAGGDPYFFAFGGSFAGVAFHIGIKETMGYEVHTGVCCIGVLLRQLRW